MIIKSTFKDYYDFVANKYGGGDPKVVYSRSRIEANFVDLQNNKLKGFYLWRKDNIEYAYLIIAGKAYLLYRGRDITTSRGNVNTYTVARPSTVEEEQLLPIWKRTLQLFGIEFGKEYPFLIELCRIVRAPVFVIYNITYSTYRDSEVEISEQCPILGKIGMPALISAEQMYQDISYFVGNLMHNPPDPGPPVQLSNMERIKKAGFDPIISFRYRK